MTAGSCTQPGCSGSIVDGYCDVCGMAGAAAPASAPAATPAATTPAGIAPAATSKRMPAANGDACQQPGCTGSILDGYCDVCGSPAVARASAWSRRDSSSVRPTNTGLTDVVCTSSSITQESGVRAWSFLAASMVVSALIIMALGIGRKMPGAKGTDDLVGQAVGSDTPEGTSV